MYCARPDFCLIFLCTHSPWAMSRSSRCPVANYYVALHSFTKEKIFAYFTRVSEFEDAILSRIYLLLRHDNLNSDARRDIWSNFLKTARTHMGVVNISPKHLKSSVKPELNGRQVGYLHASKSLSLTAFRSRTLWLRRMPWQPSRELHCLIPTPVIRVNWCGCPFGNPRRPHPPPPIGPFVQIDQHSQDV